MAPEITGLHEKVPRLNVKRGLIRFWIVVTAIWLALAGGIWISIWSHEIAHLAAGLVAQLKPAVDYDAVCAKLRAQKAAGGPVDPIPALPALEVVVEKGVATIVAAHGRCLAEFAKEEGVGLMPVAVRIMGGDGSKPAWLKAMNGNVRPFDFPEVSRAEPPPDVASMAEGLAFVLGPPLGVLILSWGIWWAAMGFRPDRARADREPPQLR